MGVISPYTIAIGRMIFLSIDLFISCACLLDASKGSDIPSSRGTRQALKTRKIPISRKFLKTNQFPGQT